MNVLKNFAIIYFHLVFIFFLNSLSVLCSHIFQIVFIYVAIVLCNRLPFNKTRRCVTFCVAVKCENAMLASVCVILCFQTRENEKNILQIYILFWLFDFLIVIVHFFSLSFSFCCCYCFGEIAVL